MNEDPIWQVFNLDAKTEAGLADVLHLKCVLEYRDGLMGEFTCSKNANVVDGYGKDYKFVSLLLNE